MSMIMILESVSADATAEQNKLTIPLNSLSGWGSGMPVGACEDDENSVSLQKAWHGLHYLLTGNAWSGSGYRAFLLCGGREQGEDMGYGPARLFDSDEVSEINNILAAITADELWSRFDAERMAEADIYGADWIDEPETDLREEYVDYFEELKAFISRTAKEGNSLRIAMT